MKNLFLFLAILISSSAFADTIPLSIPMDTIPFKIQRGFDFKTVGPMYMTINHRGETLAKYNIDDSSLVLVKDSLLAIKFLFQSSIDANNRRLGDLHILINKLEAATMILNFITTQGRVTDRQKFDSAVANYMRLIK